MFNKTASVERALSKMGDVDLLLKAGDIADCADQRQYALRGAVSSVRNNIAAVGKGNIQFFES